MDSVRPSEFSRVLGAAQDLAAAPAWCQRLADELERAVRPDAAAVYLSILGDVFGVSFAVAPHDLTPLARRLVERALPELYSAGSDTPAALFADTTGAQQTARTVLLKELLGPEGFRGLLGGFLRSDTGMVSGWIAVFTRRNEGERLAELSPLLAEVRAAAEATIRNAISIAEMVGARLPTASINRLSLREREISRLAARGFSDLNISQQLQITEGTVGRHLYKIYRKLGIGSRLELANLLAVGAAGQTSPHLLEREGLWGQD